MAARVSEGTQLAGICRSWAVACSPWQAVLAAMYGDAATFSLRSVAGGPVAASLAASLVLTVLLNAVAVWKIRVWNPSREVRKKTQTDAEEADIAVDLPPGTAREVWDRPVLWREIKTWAYGRKVLLVRLGYLLIFALAAAALVTLEDFNRTSASLVLAPLFLVSLVLVNSQAVTALTTERDAKSLELLLVTEITPKEFLAGKFAGVFYNTKEMVVLPILVCLFLWGKGDLSGENAFYVIGGLIVMYAFAAVLGIHCGLIHPNTRIAIGTSLGTVFFLFVGVATCIRIMVAFGQSFEGQLAPFVVFMLGGAMALYASLGARNASSAILCASLACPFATFYAITSFLAEQQTLGVFLVVAVVYGFAAVAMLLLDVSEFNTATGQSTSGE